jgi:hypothetical protein
MSPDGNAVRELPPGIHVVKFPARNVPARAERDANKSATPRGSAHRVPRRRRLVGGTLLVVATATSVLAGIAIGHFENTGKPTIPLHRAQSVQEPRAPRISMPSLFVVEQTSQSSFDVQIDPADAVPANSILYLRGLPPGISFSEGLPMASGAWVIPVVRLSSLKMRVAALISGRFPLTIALLGAEGASLAEATTELVIRPAQPQLSSSLPPVEEPSLAPAAPPETGATAVMPEVAILSPLERARAEKMVARGEQDLEIGNIALARQFFLRAADAGLARGAFLLAASYDARELSRLRVQGVQPNPALARKWYERARQLGAKEAEERLVRLSGG